MEHLKGRVNHRFTSPSPSVEMSEEPLNAIHVAPPHMGRLPPPPPPPPKARTVVHVENANKVYGSGEKVRQVLVNMCMEVEEHTIYGLLGASGCGKTTILSCIVALRKLDWGSILICGEPTGTPASGVPGKKVGYMPQEIAMNGEFTIVEVLAYFGRIYGMNRTEIKNRTMHLQTLLDLEGLEERIEKLSDGQKRRVSMAVSLIHEPDLLILDEPTVGLDPLLRESIWLYLCDLVANSSTTIIVTTHYIEEMREADRVGIMRSGRLLCEDSPTNLLRIYNENLLETVMAKLCKQDEGPQPGEIIRPARPGRWGDGLPGASSSQEANRRARTEVCIRAEWTDGAGGDGGRERGETSTTSSLHRLHALFVKDYLVVTRNILFSIVCILIPSIGISIFEAILDSKPTDLKIGVVNFETNACPFGGGDGLGSGSPLISIDKGRKGCSTALANLSCAFLDAIDPAAFKFIPFDKLENAENEAFNGKLWGFVWFEEDFSSQFYKRVAMDGVGADGDMLAGSRINVRLDTVEPGVGYFLRKTLIDAFHKLRGNLFELCGIDGSAKQLPIKFGDPIFSKKQPKQIAFVGMGVTISFVFFFCFLQLGMFYINEKKDGMLNRTMVAGVAKIEIMFSHFVMQLLVVALAQTLSCFLLVFVIFGAETQGSLLLGFSLVILTTMVGASLGILLGTFCSNEKNGMLFVMGLWFPTFLLSGIFYPLDGLPATLRHISHALPSTIAATGLRAIICRGMDLGDDIVWLGFMTSTAWIVGIWLLIFLTHKFGQNK